MSAAASWSYTAAATVWSLLGRDDWSGAPTFGPPEVFACDYSAKAEHRTDSAGVAFVTRQVIYTERASIKPGDRVLIGVSATADPVAAGAIEVRAVQRHADTFDRAADDFEVLT